MKLHMFSMIRVGMLTRKDLAEFSDELQQELSFLFSEKETNELRRILVADGIALGLQPFVTDESVLRRMPSGAWPDDDEFSCQKVAQNAAF